ncbi:class I SAM-dependent methyltransferase [Candidatus Saccharibacteria bacterium]|nr:class I SAM-dependent methyltransferase [Candidatus Saccharibacteria bacterium]
MSRENEKTLEVYEQHIDKFVDRFSYDPNNYGGGWIDKSLHGLPKNAKLFEVGSGTGDLARYIISLGYSIQTSDAANSFLKILKEKKLNPIKFNLIKDTFNYNYDYIVANAVLVHFTPDEVKTAIQQIFNALNQNGRFAFSVKYKAEHPNGELDNSFGVPRYFSYWTPDEIKDVVKQTGFSKVEYVIFKGKRSNFICMTAQKGEK